MREEFRKYRALHGNAYPKVFCLRFLALFLFLQILRTLHAITRPYIIECKHLIKIIQ